MPPAPNIVVMLHAMNNMSKTTFRAVFAFTCCLLVFSLFHITPATVPWWLWAGMVAQLLLIALVAVTVFGMSSVMVLRVLTNDLEAVDNTDLRTIFTHVLEAVVSSYARAMVLLLACQLLMFGFFYQMISIG